MPAANFVENGSSKGHAQSESAANSDSKQHLRPNTDSKRISRNDFSGTTSGNGLLDNRALAGSHNNPKVSVSQQEEGTSFYMDMTTESLGYDLNTSKDKQTRMSVAALRKDGYTIVEENMRTQQKVKHEEYEHMGSVPQLKHPPPVPPISELSKGEGREKI